MSELDQILSIPSVKAEHPHAHAQAAAELAALRAENEALKQALAPYANRSSWSAVSSGHGYGSYKIVTWSVDQDGYKIAREALGLE